MGLQLRLAQRRCLVTYVCLMVEKITRTFCATRAEQTNVLARVGHSAVAYVCKLSSDSMVEHPIDGEGPSQLLQCEC